MNPSGSWSSSAAPQNVPGRAPVLCRPGNGGVALAIQPPEQDGHGPGVVAQPVTGVAAASPVAFMAQPLVLAAMLARGIIDIGTPETTSRSRSRL